MIVIQGRKGTLSGPRSFAWRPLTESLGLHWRPTAQGSVWSRPPLGNLLRASCILQGQHPWSNIWTFKHRSSSVWSEKETTWDTWECISPDYRVGFGSTCFREYVLHVCSGVIRTVPLGWFLSVQKWQDSQVLTRRSAKEPVGPPRIHLRINARLGSWMTSLSSELPEQTKTNRYICESRVSFALWLHMCVCLYFFLTDNNMRI